MYTQVPTGYAPLSPELSYVKSESPELIKPAAAADDVDIGTTPSATLKFWNILKTMWSLTFAVKVSSHLQLVKADNICDNCFPDDLLCVLLCYRTAK